MEGWRNGSSETNATPFLKKEEGGGGKLRSPEAEVVVRILQDFWKVLES